MELSNLCNIYKLLKNFCERGNSPQNRPQNKAWNFPPYERDWYATKKCTTHVGDSSPKHTSLTNFAKMLQLAAWNAPKNRRKLSLYMRICFLRDHICHLHRIVLPKSVARWQAWDINKIINPAVWYISIRLATAFERRWYPCLNNPAAQESAPRHVRVQSIQVYRHHPRRLLCTHTEIQKS